MTGTLDDTAGVLALNAATGSWRLAGGTVKGGVITTADGSELVPISGTLDAVTLNCDLNVTGSSASVRVINGLALNGVATLGNNYASLGFEGTQALSGSGSVVFQSGGNGINAMRATQAGMTLTIGPSITVHGGGANPGYGGGIGYNGVFGGPLNITIINQGTISADVAGAYINIVVGPSGVFTNLGTLQANNGGTLLVNGIIPPTANVAATKLFYAASAWDATNGATFSDDNAIATNKTAYIANGAAATFNSVSSYTKGINGIMVDLSGTHGTLAASDFTFKAGNNNAPLNWATTTAAQTVTTRATAGVGGSDRVELIWTSAAVTKSKWLEVIVKGNDTLGGFDTNTGLASSYVFFFGSAPGDTGNGDTTVALVDSTDGGYVLTHPASGKSPATITQHRRLQSRQGGRLDRRRRCAGPGHRLEERPGVPQHRGRRAVCAGRVGGRQSRNVHG